MNEQIDELKGLFEANRNREKAAGMEKYMKNHFPFLGIKKPLRAELEKEFYARTRLLKEPYHQEFAERVWELPEREYQYTALGYIAKYSKKFEPAVLDFLKRLITEKSWWDSVDTLASGPVGTIARNHPEAILPELDQWAISENMWLRRTAILFQLKYKQATDENRLYTYARENADSREFFIQKAIGWALREYSKIDPHSVKSFIESTQLAALSRREASKYLD